MAQARQTYANHARFVRLYHGFVQPVLAANVIWAGWRFVRAPGVDSAFAFLVALAILFLVFFARIFALKAQDRVIRLEMRLRLREILPAAMQDDIPALSVNQLVALRFAGDQELPGLVDRVLKDDIQDRRTIKKMITLWQGDYLRV